MDWCWVIFYLGENERASVVTLALQRLCYKLYVCHSSIIIQEASLEMRERDLCTWRHKKVGFKSATNAAKNVAQEKDQAHKKCKGRSAMRDLNLERFSRGL